MPPTADLKPDTPPAAAAPVALFGLASVLALAVAVLALFLFGWLADEMLEGDTLALDLRLRTASHVIASPGVTQALILVSALGGPRVLALLGLVLIGGFASLRWWRGTVLLTLAMAGAGVLDAALKHAFHRVRPTPFFDYPLPPSYSFPSGHALFAFCFFTTGTALLAPRLGRPALRWLLWVVTVCLVLAIGFSRVYLGVHYPSDVAAGYIIGSLWSSVIIAGDRIAHAQARRRGGA
jgi:undecaprenyl-diphosphatase